MATIKNYTDVNQSKKLAEILPLESADMHYGEYYVSGEDYPIPNCDDAYNGKPCWSLAALLDVLPDGTDIIKDKTDTENEKYMCTVGVKDDIICTFGNNPVDACVEIIEKLHELKLL